MNSRATTSEEHAAEQPPVFTRPSRSRGKVALLSGKGPLAALLQSVSTQVLVIVINVATGVMTARLLGPEGRGVFAATTTWPQLLASLAVAGLSSAVVFRMRKAPEHAGGIASAALLISAITSLVAITIGVLLMPFWMARYSPAIISFSQLCLASVLINSTQMIVKQTFAGSGRFGQFNMAQLLPQLFYLIALAALAFSGSMTARGAVLALLGGGFVALLAALPAFVRLAKPSLRAGVAELRPLASYSARAALMDAVFTIASYADRIVLIPLLSTIELGLYAVAYSFSRVIQMVQPAIVSVIFSHMSRGTEANAKLLHDRALRLLLIGLVIGCAMLWAVARPLLSFAYGTQFEAANTIFRLLVIEASLGALSQVTAQLFLSFDRPGVVSTIQVVILSVSLTLLLLLVPSYGAQGAAIALVVAAGLRWLCLLGGIKLILHKPLPRLYLTREDFKYLMETLR